MGTVVNNLIEADFATHIRGNSRIFCTPGDYPLVREGLQQRSLNIDLLCSAIIITPNFSDGFVRFMDELKARVPSMKLRACEVIVFETDVQKWTKYDGGRDGHEDLHGSHRRRVSHWDSDAWQNSDGAAARRVADAVADAAPLANTAWSSYEGQAFASVDDVMSEARASRDRQHAEARDGGWDPEWYCSVRYSRERQDAMERGSHDGYPGPPPSTTMVIEDGDWICPECNDIQRKRNSSCSWCWKTERVNTPKPFGSSSDPTKGSPLYGGKGSSSESSTRKQSQG
jgi:hypothetical protein